MDVEAVKREAINGEHLRLLTLFHYISGGLTILFSSVFIVHLAFMSFVLRNADKFSPQPGQQPAVNPEDVIGIFMAIAGTFIVLGILFGIAQIVSGRFIRMRRYRIFSIIVALPNVLFIPYGTILAVMTLMVLDRKEVKKLYEDAGQTGQAG